MEIASPNTRTSVGPKQSTAQGVKESLPEARRPGLEFNVSFLPCCERKNEWSYTSPPPPKDHIWPDVTEELHLVITILEDKILINNILNRVTLMF